MTFFSRPVLEELQFKQTTGTTLSLSGLTKIRTSSGLTLSDGVGGDVLITASGASSATTEGYVLTYMNGLISLQPSSSTGGTFQFDTQAVCIPLVSSTGHGHASLKNVHYQL